MLSTDQRKTAAWTCIGILIACLTLTTLYAIFSTRELAERNTQVLDTVRSCTTPGKACYEENRKRTADVVTDINRVSLLAAACADAPHTQTVEQIQLCVLQRLQQDQRK